jgi:hypothetical protein
MTHTAEPMTLAQVSEDVKDVYYSAPDQLTEAIVPLRKLLAWKQVVDAELPKQRETQVACDSARVTEPDGCPTEKSVLKRFWRDHQQRNAVEVSEEVVELAWKALDDALNGKLDGQEYAYGDPFPMRAALSAVASRDREDAKRYRWLEKQAYVGVHPHTRALLWVIRGLFANTKSFAEDIDAARRENKP